MQPLYGTKLTYNPPSTSPAPNPSLAPQTQPTRKGLGNNLAWKCLAGMWRMHGFWIQQLTSSFRSSTWLVRHYSNIQNFYVLLYIRFLSLIELERWLAEVIFVPSYHQHRWRRSSTQDDSGPGFSPDPSSWVGSGVQTTGLPYQPCHNGYLKWTSPRVLWTPLCLSVHI